jgi:signal transduction histidine kinase
MLATVLPRRAMTLLPVLGIFLIVQTAVFAQSEDRTESDSADPATSSEDITSTGSGSLGERLAKPPASADFGQRFAAILRLQERGDYANALIDGRAAAADAEAAGDVDAQACFLFLLGRTYWIVGDFPAAVETLQHQVRLAEKLGDQDLISAGQHALGVTYTQTKDYTAAERTFEEALRHAEILGDQARIAYVLNGTANNHLAERDYPGARALYTRALAIREKIGDRVGAADSSTNLGTVDLLTGDPTSALAAYQKALAIYKSINQPRRIARGHRRVAAALRRLGRLDEAIAELRVALAIAEPLGSAPVLGEIYHELARTHEGRGELRSTLYYERRYASTREAILGEQIRLRVIELDARFQAERRENDIRLLRIDQEAKTTEIARRRQQTALLSGGLTLVLALGTVVFFAQRARLRAERAAHLADERARAEAEQAARLKSRLLQIAAHDLKAPLSAVSASARRIETQPDETASVIDLARHIRTDAAHMGGLVREFLDSAAIEAGRLQLQRTPVDLIAIARDTVDSYQSLAEAKRQSITLELPTAREHAFPSVLADAPRLRQILDNLIINALKFSPSGGCVAVALGQSGRWLFAEVRDSGPGLKPEDLSRLFQPFQSLSATPTARESSDGLGLFITRELVSMHDGLLEVESQPGQGATFRVLLPLADDPGQS